MKITIFLTYKGIEAWNINDRQVALLKSKIPDAEVKVAKNREEFERELPDTQIAIIWRFKQELVDMAPKLEWLVTPSAGKDYFSVKLPAHVESYNGSFHGELMGETAVAMMLAECRGVTFCAESDLQWPRIEVSGTMRAFRGSHVMILGFGNIGEWVARYAKPFGIKITGVKRSLAKAPDFFTDSDRIDTIDNIDKLLPEADHLVLVLPSGKETDNLIDSRRLKLLKRDAVIYNIGRGNSIDEGALAECLKKGNIKGAYLDVFKKEPLAENSPLREAPNCHIMPHSAAISPNYLDLFINEFAVAYDKKYKSD